MSVRKEQVLLILVVLLAAYCSADKLAVDVMAVRYSPTALEYEPAAFREAALVATDADDIVRRDFFTEPSETRPLPPRELGFPPRAPLTVCGLPLDPGPDYRHSWLLRLDGAAVAGVSVARGGDAGSPAQDEGEDAGQDIGVGPMSEEQAQRRYDRLYVQGLSKPFYGVLDSAQGVGPFDLEQRVGLTDGSIRHGEMLPQQMLSGRQSHRAPIENLYLCGAGTHPGGEVTGAPGHNAAQAILKDTQRVVR